MVVNSWRLWLLVAFINVSTVVRSEQICRRVDGNLICTFFDDPTPRTYPESALPWSGQGWSQTATTIYGRNYGSGRGYGSSWESRQPDSSPSVGGAVWPNYDSRAKTDFSWQKVKDIEVPKFDEFRPPVDYYKLQQQEMEQWFKKQREENEKAMQEMQAAAAATAMMYLAMSKSLSAVAKDAAKNLSLTSQELSNYNTENVQKFQAITNNAIELIGSVSKSIPIQSPIHRSDYKSIYIRTSKVKLHSRLARLDERLAQSPREYLYQQRATVVAREIIRRADQASVSGQEELAETLATIAEVLVDIATSLPPGIGWARDVYEGITGYNLISGKPLTQWEHSIAVIGMISGGYGGKLLKTEKYLGELAKVSTAIMRNKVFNSINQPRVLADGYASVKEIMRFRYNKDPGSYLINGYQYVTDAHLRPAIVSGLLKLEPLSDVSNQRRVMNAIMDLAKDQKGHLIGRQFGGVAEQLNLVPMNKILNNSSFKKMENFWAKSLRQEKSVFVQIRPIYNGEAVRPSAIEVFYKIEKSEYGVTWFNP